MDTGSIICMGWTTTWLIIAAVVFIAAIVIKMLRK